MPARRDPLASAAWVSFPGWTTPAWSRPTHFEKPSTRAPADPPFPNYGDTTSRQDVAARLRRTAEAAVRRHELTTIRRYDESFRRRGDSAGPRFDDASQSRLHASLRDRTHDEAYPRRCGKPQFRWRVGTTIRGHDSQPRRESASTILCGCVSTAIRKSVSTTLPRSVSSWKRADDFPPARAHADPLLRFRAAPTKRVVVKPTPQFAVCTAIRICGFP